MSKRPSIGFSEFSAPEKGVAIVLVTRDGKFAREAEAIGGASLITRLIEISDFKGKLGATTETMAPEGAGIDRVVLVGVGNPAKLQSDDWIRIGGAAFSRIGHSGAASVTFALPETQLSPENTADFALGMLLRAYRFEKYKTKKNDDNGEEPKGGVKITLQTDNPSAAKKAFADAEAVAGGVKVARDLVNEPANVLGPVEFAEEALKLEKLGVKVEILTEKELKKLGMGALLGVAQGSVRPPRIAVMEWNGGKSKEKPVAFVGKGVVFDTGGISIKQASGMEDMKGDMGGAAAVTGLIHALAARKAKVNAVGVIGLVENMPDGNAQRPGDIVTSMSGQTIEVLNTDAEGRLVLADALHYTNDRFKPRFMVDLATLTGAIMVALGQHHAGLFSNDDGLADQLYAAGQATGEKVWRMPLGTEYDKMIDSKTADMKNIGGRNGGAITAAQFLKRFVGDTPWAHLDVAGTAIGAPNNEYSQSWASGFGVRLLDRLVRDNFEG